MRDLTLRLPDRPGALAEMGEALGAAGVSIEGGGAFVVDGVGVAHFLVAEKDVARAREALGARLVAVREVVVQRLDQETPGQLGKLCRAMATAGVNIEVLYSDHANQLVLVVDALERAREVSRNWMQRPG